MRLGTIFVALAILCCLTGCTEKPPPKKKWASVHKLELEIPKSVIVGTEVSVTATWEGGTPPYKIVWNFPGTLGFMASKAATSPAIHKFNIPRTGANIGATYFISASITDADGLTSSSSGQFIFVEDPFKPNPSLFQAPLHTPQNSGVE